MTNWGGIYVTVHTQEPAKELVDLTSGKTYPLRKIEGVYDKDPFTEYVTEIVTDPGMYRAFKVVR